jgi:hypothetical protein
MSPLTRLYRRSRAFRILCYVALVPVYIILGFVAINSFGGYSQVGNALGLAAIVAFAAWAWWWDERREARLADLDRERGDAG